MSIQFRPATRKQKPLKIALTGPSGSGKTYSALTLAYGLGSRVALIDTENHSASLYSDEFKFDTVELDPPFEIKKYRDAIQAAEEAGYDVLVIDSLSHAWAGEGGLLSKKESLDARGGNSYTNWASISKEHELLKSSLLHSPLHLIVTMRSKQDYVMQENEKGKLAPRKVGMAPIQREGMEYEFDVVFDLGMDHSFSVSKDRTKLFDGQIDRLTKAHGEKLLAWREGGEALLSKEQLLELKNIMSSMSWEKDRMKEFINECGYESGADIPASAFEKLRDALLVMKHANQKAEVG